MGNQSNFLRACVLIGVFEPACEINFSMPLTCDEVDHVDGSVGIGQNSSADRDAGRAETGVRRDAALSRDAAADARTDGDPSGTPRDAGVSEVGEGIPSDVIAAVQSPSQCWGRHLSATHEFVRYAAAGMSVWHLCYHTALWDAVVPGTDPRPAHVTFFRYDPVAHFPSQFAQAEAPSAANPWTANVMIAMPPGASFVPYFNLGNVREGGATPDVIWAVQPNTTGGPLALNGVLQVWQVNADGSQTFVRPQLLCDDALCPATETHDFLVPETGCEGPIPSAAACGLTSSACSLLPLP